MYSSSHSYNNSFFKINFLINFQNKSIIIRNDNESGQTWIVSTYYLTDNKISTNYSFHYLHISIYKRCANFKNSQLFVNTHKYFKNIFYNLKKK